MKILFYETYKTYFNALFVCIIILSFIGSCFSFYNEIDEVYIESNEIYKTELDYYKAMSYETSKEEIESQIDKIKFLSNYDFYAMRKSEDNDYIDEVYDNLNDKALINVINEYTKNGYSNLTNDKGRDLFIYGQILSNLSHVNEYGLYLDSVEEEAKEMLKAQIFFRDNTFSKDNILKTVDDFKPLYNVSLKTDVNWFSKYINNMYLTDMALVLVTIMLCISLLLKEKTTNAFSLIKPTQKGQRTVIYSKIALLFLSVMLFSIIFYGSNLLILGNVLGYGDLSRSVQSLPDFNSCILNVSVGEFLALFVLTKITVMILIGLVAFFLILYLNSASLSFIVLGAIGVFQYISYAFIDNNSYLNHLKFINIFYYLDTKIFLERYQNINLFNTPFNVYYFIILVPVLIIVVTALIITIYSNFHIDKKSLLIDKVVKKIVNLIPGHANLFLHEAYKTLWVNKGIVIIVILCVLLYNGANDQFVFTKTAEEVQYQKYTSYLEGELTDDTNNYFEETFKYFEKTQNEYYNLMKQLEDEEITKSDFQIKSQKYNAILRGKRSFDVIFNQYNYLKSIEIEKEKNYIF